MSIPHYLLAALGLAILMIVHEGGHYFAARRFGMRVTRFSIGFGPTLWKHKPKGSPTTYQVALIPFLAYVQIAGMNPYEETDPNDPGSYANASLWGRIVTIAAGPLMNYLFASVLIFAGLIVGGKQVADPASMRLEVDAPGPAASADIRDGDKVLAINDQPVRDWDELKAAISAHPGEPLDILVERGSEQLHKTVTPIEKGKDDEGKILVRPMVKTVPVGVLEAAKQAVIQPPLVVYETVRGIARLITLKEKPQVSGPVGIMNETAKQSKRGPGILLCYLGILSAYLGAFNLLPVPALDGGRLLFLGVEAASRRKLDAKVEARVHALGLLMLLAVIAVVTYSDVMPRK